MQNKRDNIQQIGTRFFNSNRDYSCVQINRFLQTFDFPMPLVRQKGVLFILVTRGTLDMHIGYDQNEIQQGTLVIIQPNKPFSVQKIADEIEGVVLYIKSDGMMGRMGDHSLIFSLGFLETWSKSVFTINKELLGFIQNIFNRIYWEQANNKNNTTIVNAYVITLLLELNHIHNDLIHTNRSAVELSQKFKKEVFNTLDQQLSIAQYAKRLSVSSNHLNKAVKSATGNTASALFNKIKLLEARYLLMLSENTIGEIAIQLGFEDTSYFSRFFKKHLGASPSEYRRTVLQ